MFTSITRTFFFFSLFFVEQEWCMLLVGKVLRLIDNSKSFVWWPYGTARVRRCFGLPHIKKKNLRHCLFLRLQIHQFFQSSLCFFNFLFFSLFFFSSCTLNLSYAVERYSNIQLSFCNCKK